jgi:hypothetical protein
MRKPIYLSMMMCLACAVISKKSFAQVARTDSSSQQNALNNTLTLFYSSIGDQSPLYNGPEYYFYDPLIKGNAYFSDINAFAPGSVFYDGLLFNGVPMLYDLYADKVVVLLYNHFSKFSLIQERVKSFDFLNHHFVNIKTDTLNNNSVIKSGFYDELYKGKLQVLVKRSKSIQTTTGGATGPLSYFDPSTDYYLRKNNTYYSFGSQGSMLSILKDKKKELQQYIRANEIRFRKNPEEAMVKIASYYDHLTN